MKEYPVIYFDPKHKSFNWARGLYFIIQEKGTEIYIAKLNDGEVDRYNDNTLNVSVTGKINCVETKMVFRSDEDFQFTGKL